MKEHLKQLVRDSAPLQGRNVAREYLQSRILGAVQRAGAMTSLAFQGGTCLRFVYGLPRYSEDLDFALEGDRSSYDLRAYLRAVRSELGAENYRVELSLREQKTVNSGVVRLPGILYEVGLSPHASEVLAVRVEVDTRPPAGAGMEIHLVRRHVTLRLHCHDRSSLLAGKVHAVLQRPYAKRPIAGPALARELATRRRASGPATPSFHGSCTGGHFVPLARLPQKGRDWFDLIWYLSDPEWPPPNLDLLNAALAQSGWTGEALGPQTWRGAIGQRLRELDWARVVADVRPFLEQQHDVDLIGEDSVARLLR